MNFHWGGQKESDATTETFMTTRRCDLHQGKVKRCTCHYRVQYARVICNLIGRLILSTLAFCNMSSTGLRLLVRILDTGCWQKRGVRCITTHTQRCTRAHTYATHIRFSSPASRQDIRFQSKAKTRLARLVVLSRRTVLQCGILMGVPHLFVDFGSSYFGQSECSRYYETCSNVVRLLW